MFPTNPPPDLGPKLQQELLSRLSAEQLTEIVLPMANRMLKSISNITPTTPGRVLERGVCMISIDCVEGARLDPEAHADNREPTMVKADQDLAMLGVSRHDGRWVKHVALYLYDVVAASLVMTPPTKRQLIKGAADVRNILWGVFIWPLRVFEQANVAELNNPPAQPTPQPSTEGDATHES